MLKGNGPDRPAIVEDARVLDLGSAGGFASVREIVAGGAAALDEVTRVASAASEAAWIPLAEARFGPPLGQPPKNVFCIGRNYRLHIEEGARARGREVTFPPAPEIFTKPPTAVIGDGDEVLLPRVTAQLDYEVELAFVVGRRVKDIAAEDALDAIFGYTIVNDVTARDLQLAHGQWFKGKALDNSCPVGPWIVTRDAFDVRQPHRIGLRVNGEQRQDSDISDMLFDCAQILASLSAGMTLEPGDLVATGTPSGVGMGFEPPRWLRDGDVIEAEIEGIGTLRNTVRAA